MENLTSDNKQSILEILDALRARAERDELLQLFIVVEDGAGFDANWTGTEDRYAISGFALGAIITRMGFVRPPDPD